MTTITKERLLKIQQWREAYGTGSNVMLPAEEAEELARIALVSLTAEPVAWRLLDSPESSVTVTDNEKMAAIWKRNGRNVQPLYSTAHGSADAVGMVVSEGRQPSAHNPDSRIFEVLVESGYEPVPGDKLYAAPPASERDQIRREHAGWSDATFGDVGPIGPLKHLSKEALEAAAEPGDLSEWADMQFLLWDAQRRAGISDEQITQAMIEKLAINKARQWPEPKNGEPRLHIKEQPAPVVPEEMPKGLAGQIVSLLAHNIGDKLLAQKIWNACRAAMLQSKYRDLSQPVDPQISEYEKIMLRAGWAMVPVEPTDEMIAAAMNCEDVLFNSDESFCVQFGNIYEAMLAAAPKPQNAPQNIPENIPAGKSTLTPDGWISCSERMPEDEQEVIVQNKLGYRYVSYFDEHSGLFFDMPGGNQVNCIEHILVTHWMPLPAPPQQEVNNE